MKHNFNPNQKSRETSPSPKTSKPRTLAKIKLRSCHKAVRRSDCRRLCDCKEAYTIASLLGSGGVLEHPYRDRLTETHIPRYTTLQFSPPLQKFRPKYPQKIKLVAAPSNYKQRHPITNRDFLCIESA